MTLISLILVAVSRAISATFKPFLPIYFALWLSLPYHIIGVILALMYASRLCMGIAGLWIDKQPQWHTRLLAILAILSGASLGSLVYFSPWADDSVNQADISADMSMLILAWTVHEFFFQSLSAVIDSILIKVLADYRILFFDTYERWGKSAFIVGVFALGWITDNLWIMIFSLIFIGIGALVLVITSFRIDVEPADANQLNINEDQAPLFLKNAVLQYTDSTATNNLYKPYSLFGEQLSHISEEDASMLRRMTSNAASSLYRQTSISSTHSAMSNTTTTGAYNNLAYDDLAAEHGPYTRMSRTVVSSMEVAMLPLPSPTMPMIALVLLFIPSISLPDESLQWTTTTLTGWKNMSLLINMMLLGMARSMVNTFLLIFLYDTVHIPMYQIGIMIIIPVAIDILLRASAQQWIYRWSLTTVTSFIHSLLIISIFGFSWLRQDSIGTQIAMVLLQTGQGIGMHLIWLTASNRIMAWMRTDQQLMLQRAKMSALYSSLGPAFGALIAGFVMHAHDAHFREGFTFLCQCAIGMLAGSYVLSWGWTFDA